MPEVQRYRVIGHYSRTVNGHLEWTTNSIAVQKGSIRMKQTLDALWKRLEARESWVPFGPVRDKFADPEQSNRGGTLQYLEVKVEAYEACPRCGQERSACGGPANPHE